MVALSRQDKNGATLVRYERVLRGPGVANVASRLRAKALRS